MKTKAINKSTIIFLASLFLLFMQFNGFSQVKEREIPKEWEKLVEGGRFRDLFLPMQGGKKQKVGNWGADAVKNRFVDNGIEDKTNSYWGGNIKFADGKYHLFVCGWPESSSKGHMAWPGSIVYHTVSKDIHGPYKIVDTIGKGHNPEIFQAKDGSYILYVIDGSYRSKSLNGPWVYEKLSFDKRDRPIIEGLSNLTFAKREDGSQLMVCRGGGIWFSETGGSSYQQVSNQRVYPPVEGEFEDPVVWKDHIQYHLIVNDWLGRIAFYLRSPDGINWVTDPGQAYTVGIAKHKDGTSEDWFKYERIKIFQDDLGRAISANFAVIDTIKWEDKPNDKYSSKNIVIPLRKPLLLEYLNAGLPQDNEEIRILVKSEKGFNAAKDLDLASIRFGANDAVNYGAGSKILRTEKTKGGLILIFDSKGHQLKQDEFAPKLLGKNKKGGLVFGYTRVPWAQYEKGILSAWKPIIKSENAQSHAQIILENFGTRASKAATVQLFQVKEGKRKLLGESKFDSIQPYAKREVEIKLNDYESSNDFILVIDEPESKINEWSFKLND